MAVKKTATRAGGTKSAAKKSAKASAPKKSAARAGGARGGAKASPKKASAPKKKAAPVKLTDNQRALLQKISGAREGYLGPKAEGRMLESLQTKKLIKRGAKDKESGTYRYSMSKAGEKHLASGSGQGS